MAGSFDHGNKPLSLTKDGIFLASWTDIRFSRTLLYGFNSLDSAYLKLCLLENLTDSCFSYTG
jgi:hypothetical protein